MHMMQLQFCQQSGRLYGTGLCTGEFTALGQRMRRQTKLPPRDRCLSTHLALQLVVRSSASLLLLWLYTQLEVGTKSTESRKSKSLRQRLVSKGCGWQRLMQHACSSKSLCVALTRDRSQQLPPARSLQSPPGNRGTAAIWKRISWTSRKHILNRG